MSSFSIPLSGMLASEQALNVISDNIANSNTQGFKSNSVLFEDAMNEAFGNPSRKIDGHVGSILHHAQLHARVRCRSLPEAHRCRRHPRRWLFRHAESFFGQHHLYPRR